MNFKELENGYRNWVSKQSFPVQVTVSVSNAIRGAAFGGPVGAAAQVAGHIFPHHSLAIKSKAFLGTPMEEARVFAAARGINASIACVMKRIRGKEDVQTTMAAVLVS
ncbi:chloroplastic import inner membrane translocase subunit HP30-2-like [Papaver somniferum]|uniref:chloroplastic import inner membrane translocase subunit HP30-2-like n=1 Tax=Papaver somniferum TaxID=3469 RepID=UPI000E6FA522|nr:chloroplastic import inner membrane translocase subunit HP30-2-like [Papaver somniferum]